ncbi:MAG: HAMP domain-containing histidine kinase, partial [Gammaproteobacteria bacterium]|nr:HAMP domain-containing histidine kinase [Gammaproteobacteria bacterium]
PLAKSLHQMSHQLLEQIQIHKDLSNIIAHEVRTPLSRMKFVLQRIHKDIPEKQLQRLKADIKELETLAHEYLEFGRSQITDEDYLQRFEINEFLEHLQEKYAHVEPNITFHMAEPTTATYFNWYQLDLAVSNLINNASRYANKKIKVSVLQETNSVDIIVEDDGPGFTATQKASAENDNHHGFGLGLYITKQVAARHSGKFTISESEDLGAKMIITLPLIKAK